MKSIIGVSFSLASAVRVRTSEGESAFVDNGKVLENDLPAIWAKFSEGTVFRLCGVHQKTDTFFLAVDITAEGETTTKGIVLRRMSWDKIWEARQLGAPPAEIVVELVPSA